MSNFKTNIFGREFNLNIIYDVYDDEEILDNQKEALESFKKVNLNSENILNQLIKYCLKENKEEIEEPITNIFKYVIPQEIFVKREEKKHIIAILCNYKFDFEHGIALIFENEKLVHISTQDCIL